MKIATRLVALGLLVGLPAAAEGPGFRDELLDRLAGTWLMRGTIAGDEVNHDVDAEWVLDHNYLRIHEVAREKDERGEPAYEAIIFIGWDEPSGRYVCLWLDTTGGGGLNGELGWAEPDGDEIAWVFGASGSVIHNTFAYDRDSDTWSWAIDTGPPDSLRPFARVTLTRQ